MWSLTVNLDETKYLCSWPTEQLKSKGEKEISHCQNYVYQGVTFDKIGINTSEIEKRIIQPKKIVGCLNTILWNKELTE